VYIYDKHSITLTCNYSGLSRRFVTTAYPCEVSYGALIQTNNISIERLVSTNQISMLLVVMFKNAFQFSTHVYETQEEMHRTMKQMRGMQEHTSQV